MKQTLLWIILLITFCQITLAYEEYPLGKPVTQKEEADHSDYPVGSPEYELQNSGELGVSTYHSTNPNDYSMGSEDTGFETTGHEDYPLGTEVFRLDPSSIGSSSNNQFNNSADYPLGSPYDVDKPFEMYPIGTTPISEWAKALQSCVSAGEKAARSYARRRKKRSPCGFCAYGTRHAIMCAMRKTNMPINRDLHCGYGAFQYHGKCLKSFGFKVDMTQCQSPGVLRVYHGPDGKVRPKTCRIFGGGRNCGHFEFKGTDGRWHAACTSPISADKKPGNSRRKLVACYVPK